MVQENCTGQHSEFSPAGSARSCVKFRIYQLAHGDICEMHTLRSSMAFWRTDSSLIVIIITPSSFPKVFFSSASQLSGYGYSVLFLSTSYCSLFQAILLLQLLCVFTFKMLYFVAWNEMPRCKVLSHSLNLLSLISSELSGSVAGCLTLVGNSQLLLVHYLFPFSLASFPHAVRMLPPP